MFLKHEKKIAAASCLLGILGVSGGMTKGNDVLFVAGLGFIVGGYLIIRRGLKASGRKKR